VDLRAVADESLAAAFGFLIPHIGSPRGGIQRFGGAVAIVSGLPAAFYNPVLIFEDAVTPDDVRAAVAWSRDRAASPSLQVSERLDGIVAPLAGELGVAANPWHSPSMTLRPVNGAMTVLPEGLETRVVDLHRLEDWHAVLGSGPNFRRAFGPSLLADPGARLVVGYADARPVTAAAAIVGGDAIGVYAVGTIESARRRGFGKAITWAAIDAGRRAWGLDTAILQSSEMGLPVYRSMGFVEVNRYVTYEPAPLETPA
jgi:GNAT superfamily N-acetyltransferase